MIDEPTLAQLLEQARSFVDERKFLHATQVYRRIINEVPTLDIAWIELSHVYYEMKQYDAAERLLLQVVERGDNKDEILFLIGNLFLKLAQYDRALGYYKRLLPKEIGLPKDFRAHLHFNTGLAYFYQENARQSEQHFRVTYTIDPKFPKINESLGELLLRRGAVAEAAQHLKAAIKIDRYSWIAHYLLGMAYSKSYEWQKAYDEFVAAVEIDPNEPNAWQMCGEVSIMLHQLDEAEQYLRKALELNPHFTDAVVNFGYLFLQRGDPQRALEFFDKALSLEPHHHKALQGKRQLKVSERPQS
ncbi:MAG TPA: tetratricopeptide repeat protein [Bacteroidota bacterium]|nr:tetratricopeptide repeat protein [Bacteroidota bacterium]